jgi:protein-L-isoaspartate(D-aspartate) O-methyltransferase
MSVYANRRRNMVESQLRVTKVTDDRVIMAFENVPREEFVSPELKGLAYIDEDLVLGFGRFMLEPMVLARLIQALDIKSDDTILDIAAGCGYSTALLSSLGQSVVGIEAHAELAKTAQENLIKMSVDNSVILHGDHQLGFASEAPYDAIIIEGAVAYVPEHILDQLSEQGRLVTVIRDNNAAPGKATLFQRTKTGFSQQYLFDAQTPILTEFNKVTAFQF